MGIREYRYEVLDLDFADDIAHVANSWTSMQQTYCEPGEPAGYPIRIPIPRIQQRSIPETCLLYTSPSPRD